LTRLRQDWAKKNSVLLYPSASVTVFSEKTVSEKFPNKNAFTSAVTLLAFNQNKKINNS